jgi:hypothetical protein
VIGAVPAVVAVLVLRAVTDWDGVSGAWLDLVSTTVIVGLVMGLSLLVLRTPELTSALRAPAVERLIRSRATKPSTSPGKP